MNHKHENQPELFTMIYFWKFHIMFCEFFFACSTALCLVAQVFWCVTHTDLFTSKHYIYNTMNFFKWKFNLTCSYKESWTQWLAWKTKMYKYGNICMLNLKTHKLRFVAPMRVSHRSLFENWWTPWRCFLI